MTEDSAEKPVAAEITADEPAGKRAADRKRLAILLGRILARHWVRHHPDGHEGVQKDFTNGQPTDRAAGGNANDAP